MSSPMNNQFAVGAETAYGTPNTASGIRAYQSENDGGWSPITGHIRSDGFYAGRQAPLDETVEAVIKGWQATYNLFVRTHGQELLWLNALGTHAAAVSAAGTTPQVYDKTYSTSADGPSGSLTVIQDRFQHKAAAANNLLRSVYEGTMIKGFTLGLRPDEAWKLGIDMIAQGRPPPTEETSPLTATYASASSGEVAAFAWKDTQFFVGNAGAVAGSHIGFLRSFDYTHDNHLDENRYYPDGDANMAQPFQMGTATGTVSLEFDMADSVNTAVTDQFREGNLISLQAKATRTPYEFTLWLPTLFITEATDPAQMEGSTIINASAELRWAPSASVPAARVTLRTEGNSNP